MRKSARHATIALSLASLLAGAALVPLTASAASPESIAEGKKVAWDRKKGNCLACHAIPTDPEAVSPGDIGPPLVAMQARFPDRKALYDQVYDAAAKNPETRMPPFGKYGALSKDQVEAIVDYLYTL